MKKRTQISHLKNDTKYHSKRNNFDYKKIFVNKIDSPLLTCILSILVFIRVILAEPPFSFDYSNYLFILDRISSLSYIDIIWNKLNFIYVETPGIVDIEFGFALLVKTISLTGAETYILFAIIAAASVGLRVYVMQKVGVPLGWMLLINLFAITMFESNAIRLGLASSILLYGLYSIYNSNYKLGAAITFFSCLFHAQTLLFFIPFLLTFLIYYNIRQSWIVVYFSMMLSGTMAAIMTLLITEIENEKVLDYAEMGKSPSTGFTVTSVTAFVFMISLFALCFRLKKSIGKNSFFISIIYSTFFSVILLIFSNTVAVLGDRAWQLGYIMISIFFFSNWSQGESKSTPSFILFVLTTIMLINVLLRYPLSNFFSPLFPQIYL